MSDLKVNIHEYDENSHSIIVSFTSGNFTTQKLAFQPHNHDFSSIDDAIKQLAIYGNAIIDKEVKKQEYLANTALVDSVRNLANTEHVFTQSQLETVTVESINTSLEVQI